MSRILLIDDMYCVELWKNSALAQASLRHMSCTACLRCSSPYLILHGTLDFAFTALCDCAWIRVVTRAS